MGSMKQRPHLVLLESPRPTARGGPHTGQVELPSSLVAACLIGELKAYVAEHGLVGGTKKARDKVKHELQHRAVDLLDIPEDAKGRLNGVLTIRGTILDNNERAARIGRVNSKEMLDIAKYLKGQLELHSCNIAGPEAEADLRLVLGELYGEIAQIEQMEKRIGPDVRTALLAKEDGPRRTFIRAALMVNGILLKRYAGDGLATFNAIVSQVMAQYVNVEFPESVGDLLKGV
jgi:hypothetical protein